MLEELPCVWTAIFSESGDYSFGYNEKLLATAIAHEYSSSSSKDVLSTKHGGRLFSLKRVLQLILESGDSEIINEALEALFKLREELIGTFTEVSKEQGFRDLLAESIKLIIVDAFNRKVKEGNQDFSPALLDISKVKNVESYLKVASEIKALVREIKKVDREIDRTTKRTEEAKKLRSSIDEKLQQVDKMLDRG